MKTLLMLSLLALATPMVSFADEGIDGSEAAVTNADESLEAAPPRWRLGYQCVATNFRRQRFVGRDWNLGRARNEALRSCNRRSFFRTCRIQYCSRIRF